MTDLVSNEVCIPPDPEALVTAVSVEGDGEVKQHVRKPSIGKSLVGSIRTLGRRSMASKPSSPEKPHQDDRFSPRKHAAQVPLPSSPIDIPPPTLQVDLGPAALVSPGFGRSLDSDRAERIPSPTSDHGRLVPSYFTGKGRDHGNTGEEDQAPPVKPSELLHVPTHHSDLPRPSTPENSRPAFTGTQLDLDGTNDSTELFERSVEYKDKFKKKEGRKLKKMVSLDAFAEECASRSSSKLGTEENTETSDRPSGLEGTSKSRTCVINELAALRTASAGHRDPTTGEWKSADPFAPGNYVDDLANSGPPTPGRNIQLPFRPKITLQSEESSISKTITDGLPSLSAAADDADTANGVQRKPSMAVMQKRCLLIKIYSTPRLGRGFAGEDVSDRRRRTARSLCRKARGFILRRQER